MYFKERKWIDGGRTFCGKLYFNKIFKTMAISHSNMDTHHIMTTEKQNTPMTTYHTMPSQNISSQSKDGLGDVFVV